MDDQHLIFLSYASPDKERVFEFYDALSNRGLNVWMDKRRLKGGQDWDFEISRALQKAAIVVVFLSENSVDRRGYAQREIRTALSRLNDKLIDDIYVIPVMLDDGIEIPELLKNIQVIRIEDGDQKQAVIDAIEVQLEKLGVRIELFQNEVEVNWSIHSRTDSWEGLPGYDATYQLPVFQSKKYKQIGEITDVLRGWLSSTAMNERSVKFEQSSDFLNFGQERFKRQNAWEATCSNPTFKDRIVTVTYSIWWYGAGAAHPNQYFKTFSFTLDPVTQIESPESIFKNPDEALPILQNCVRESLLSLTFGGVSADDTEMKLPEDCVLDGTKKWENLANIVFAEDGIEFLFGSYEVGPYALGTQSALVSYTKVAKLMKRHVVCALGIEHLLY